jgi:hypothetical protein
MASRAQLARLQQRIDALATRFAPAGELEPPPEHWLVEGDKAWAYGRPEDVISFAELESRPTGRTSYPTRIVSRFVHADSGRPAACCSVGGSCYAVHGPIGAV